MPVLELDIEALTLQRRLDGVYLAVHLDHKKTQKEKKKNNHVVYNTIIKTR